MGRIEAGSKQVKAAGETMAEIVASVRRVTELIAEISAASQEQSQSLSQVSDTVQQLEKVTQQNAAMVEQATAASASLEEQAQSLTRAVGTFKLAEEEQAGVRGEKARARPVQAHVPNTAVLSKHAAKPAVAELKAPKEGDPGKRRAAGGRGKADEEGWEEF